MIDAKMFLISQQKNDQKTDGQGDRRWLRNRLISRYDYDFEIYHEMIATNLSKQEALDFDPQELQEYNFPRNLDRAVKTTMFFIIEEVKETILDFSQGTVRVL